VNVEARDDGNWCHMARFVMIVDQAVGQIFRIGVAPPSRTA
jgi:hypothetical protein